MNELTTAKACIAHLALDRMGQGTLYDNVVLMKESLGKFTECAACEDKSELAEAILDATERVQTLMPQGPTDLRHDATIILDHYLSFAKQLVS